MTLDYSLLDNPAWYAIAQEQASLATIQQAAARYHPDISPFAALAPGQQPGALAGLTSVGDIVALAYPEREGIKIPPSWKTLASLPLHQMVCTEHDPRPDGVEETATLPGRLLTQADEDAMYQLARLTEPGPFEIHTWKMGRYFGMNQALGGENTLVAMAGERFRMNGWVEVSGVCTHEAARGKGYASALVSRLLQLIIEEGSGAFLHVRVGSPSEQVALRTYEKLGFVRHQMMVVSILQLTE